MQPVATVRVVRPDCGENDPTRIVYEKFRHKVYCEVCGYEPVRPDGRERDEHDCNATYIILYQGGDVVGGCRVIRIRSREGTVNSLPIQERGDYTGELKVPCVEISRVAFNPRMDNPRDSRDIFYHGLYTFLFEEGIKWGYASVQEYYCCELDRRFPGMTTALRKNKIRRKKGDGKVYYYIPVIISVERWGFCYKEQEKKQKSRTLQYRY